jgi:hypothetical protein
MNKDPLWACVTIPGNKIVRLMKASESFLYFMKMLNSIPFSVKLASPLRQLHAGVTTAKASGKRVQYIAS